MDIYGIHDIKALIAGNPYVGRGILVGKTPDGTQAVTAYFIMGRSDNSRNRIFVERDGALYTEPFDPSRVKDPSLIIYAALRQFENKLIVTNGDQTDTVYEGLQAGNSFSEALSSRCFEPDGPNFTPRISGMLTFGAGDFTYELSILKSVDAEGSDCARYTGQGGSWALHPHLRHRREPPAHLPGGAGAGADAGRHGRILRGPVGRPGREQPDLPVRALHGP